MIENRPKILNLINKLNKNKVDKDVYSTFTESINKKIDDNSSAIDEIANNEVRVELVEQTTKSTINKYIEDGTIANLTIEDNSIETIKYKDESVTEEKIDKNLINELKYVYDKKGNKYIITIDKDGNIVKNRIYEIPTDGLIFDVYMKNGSPYEGISQQTFSKGIAVNETDFYISQYKISEDSFDEFTYIALFDYPIMRSHSGILFSDNFNWNKSLRWQYGDKLNFSGLGVGEFGWNGAGYSYSPSAKITNKIAKNGFMYIGISFKKDGTISAYQDDNYFSLERKEDSLSIIPTIGYWSAHDPYKRICFYNRALTNEELYNIYKAIQSNEFLPIPAPSFKNGLKGLSSPSAYVKTGNSFAHYFETDTSEGNKSINISGIERTWNNIEYSPVSVTEDTSSIEELLWTHIKDELELDDIFACEAYPYPYNIHTTRYNVEYESSNPEIIECIKGVLFAKKIGSATITAKLSNSNLSCSKEISVINKPTIKEDFLYLSENYSDGINSLINESPRAVASAIKSAIYEAARVGYNGIVFPKREYNVRFDDCNEEDIFIQVPSDFIIDFNDSIWNIQEREDIATRGVKLFRFGQRKDKEEGAEGTYGDWEICQNSIIKNLTVYGERYFKTYTQSEMKGDMLALFTACSRNCKLENIYVNGMTGWLTDAQCSGYGYWTGKGDGDNRRGRTIYQDYVSGKLDETGTEVIEDPTGMWYCTPEYLKTGYTYGKDSIKSNEMDKYLFGFMGIVTYGNSGRWYDIYFFDEEKNLISYNPKQFGLEPYQYPENAVYFKVNVPFGEAPTKNSGEDNCVIRLFPYVESEHIVYDNCKFINPQYTSFSMTGGRDCIIRNCICDEGVVSSWKWAIDWEDGWQDMRHNIHYNTIVRGNVVFPGSHHNCILNCFITGNFTVSNDTEDVILVNNIINSGSIQAKTNNSILYNYYNGSLTLKTTEVGINRDSNNEKISDYNTFII